VERYIYDPYGLPTALLPDWSPQSTSPYGWQYLHQGLRYDAGSVLYDSRYRVRRPTLGRWLQPDPIGFAAGDNNFYRDEGNGPTNGLDPAGLQDIATGVAAGFYAARLSAYTAILTKMGVSADSLRRQRADGKLVALNDAVIDLGGGEQAVVLAYKDYSGRAPGGPYNRDGMQFQIFASSETGAGRLRFVQFSRRSVVVKEGKKPPEYFPITALDHTDADQKTTDTKRTYYSKPNEWRLDTYSAGWIWYDARGARMETKYPKGTKLSSHSIFDKPGLWAGVDPVADNWDSETASFQTYLVLDESRIVYQINWERTVKREEGGKWGRRYYNVTHSQPVTLKTLSLPVGIFDKEWHWLYEDNSLKKSIKVQNQLKQSIVMPWTGVRIILTPR